MNSFDFYSPTYFVFGRDRENDTGKYVAKFGGSRVLIVYGGQSAKRSGLLDRVKASVNAAGLYSIELGGVKSTPKSGFVYEGIELARREKIDFLVAIGGGSAIDSAKAIAYGLAEPEQDVWDLYEHTRTAKACLPSGVVLTLSATGSEMSDSSVITKEEENKKRGYNSDLCRPRFAVMNPALTMTLPDYQTACGCTDIMMHTLERYFNPIQGNETTMQLAEAVLRVVIANGPAVIADAGNLDAMSEIMWCGSLSHNGLTGLGGAKGLSVHPVSFALSEKYDIIHGEALSALWCSWARYVCKVSEDNFKLFARFARNVWDIAEPDMKKAANAGIDASEAYFKSLGMPVSIGELSCGVQDEAGIEDLAARVSYHGTRRVGTLVSLDHEALREIFAMANH